MTIRFVVSVAALAGLTACGGGGAGNLGNPVDLSNFPNASYGDLDTAADFLNSYSDSANATSFPSTTATYYGVILMAEDLDPSLADSTLGVSTQGVIGQVELIADFSDPSGVDIDGTATNFYQTNINLSGNPDGSTTGALSGTLVLSATGLTDNFFELSAVGTVAGDTVTGTFDDNAPFGPDNLVPGFKTSDASGIWVRTSDGGQLNVVGSNNLDAVIAAER